MVGPAPLTLLKVGSHEVPIYRMGEPVVALVARPQFALDVRDPKALATLGIRKFNIAPQNKTTDGELLMEMGGRRCYESYDNKGGKTTEQYLDTIIGHGHGSVLEHAFYVFHLWRISRGATHELVRHRAGTSFSQLSTRYVDHLESPAVDPLGILCPPLIWDEPRRREAWLRAVQADLDAYAINVEGIMEQTFEHLDETKLGDRTHKRKMARQSARSGLPNGSETRMQFGANVRALIHIITMRGDEGADFEIRAIAVALLRVMQKEAPGVFGKFEIYRTAEGDEAVKSPFRKP